MAHQGHYLTTERKSRWREYSARIPALFLAAIIAACGTYVVRGPADEASPYYRLPAGSVLVLHRKVVIAADRARVFFQRGAVGSALSELEPHCQLEVRKVLPTPQTVFPDEFIIQRVAYDVTEMVALPGLFWANGGDGGSDGVSDIMKLWKMPLHSDNQPNVLQLICGGALDHPARAHTPSVREIRATLGSYASLRLPPS